MEVYAVAYLAGDPRAGQRVPTDRAGGRDPTWNHTVLITVPASGAGCGAVRVLLRAERAGLGGDRDVGEVLLPLPDVLAGAGDGPTTEPTAACFPVRRVGCSSSRRAQGVLNVSYKLGGVVCPDHVARAEGAPPAAAARAGDSASPMVAYLAAAAKAYSAARPTQCTPYPVAPVGASASMRGRS
ncbi:unnamed protein product [Urochloa decumbens]|uniref:C2 domain-containing protein n=1 Tax=Urochloa decumbens TaxID=240449 RepID=A0ABC9GGB3_9POAL